MTDNLLICSVEKFTKIFGMTPAYGTCTNYEDFQK